jgi:hypothetical protein
MIKSIANFISSIASAIGGFFSWKSSPVNQRREAEKDLKKEESEKAKLKAEISDAIHAGDDEKLNEIMTRLLPVVFCVFSTAFLVGCYCTKTTIKYVPTDRRIESCTNSIGIACKAVPNAVFEELVNATIELQDLQREIKLEKRISK